MKSRFYCLAICLSLLAFTSSLLSAPPNAWFGYVANDTTNDVVPIQLATGTGASQTAISLSGSTPETGPVAIALTPDGNRAYVVNNSSPFFQVNATVVVINTLTNAIESTIVLPRNIRPIAVAIAPDGQTAYVLLSGSVAGAAPGVALIDTNSNSLIETILLPDHGMEITAYTDIAIAPDGQTAYVIDGTSGINAIIPINLTNLTIGTAVPVMGVGPVAISLTPDGQKAYIVNVISQNVSIFNLIPLTFSSSIAVSNTPTDVAVNPSGTRAYVVTTDLIMGHGHFIVIDTAADAIITTIEEGAFTVPTSLAIAPDGFTAYVTNFNGDSVTPILVSTDTPIVNSAILLPEGSSGPVAIAITPDQAPVAAFKVNTTVIAGEPIQFDASSSFSPIGTISLYVWDFGDGTTVVTTSPFITHTYTAPGSFLVTLTVINSAGTSTTQVFTGQTLSRNGGPSAQSSQIIQAMLASPRDFRVHQVKNEFATQTEYVNILTWKAPKEGLPPFSYRIYRDAGLTRLVATISAKDQLRFEDHNRRKDKAYTYYLVSVNRAGQQSSPAIVTVNP